MEFLFLYFARILKIFIIKFLDSDIVGASEWTNHTIYTRKTFSILKIKWSTI